MALTSGDALRIIGTHGRRATVATQGFDYLRSPDTVLRADIVKEGLLRRQVLSETTSEKIKPQALCQHVRGFK